MQTEAHIHNAVPTSALPAPIGIVAHLGSNVNATNGQIENQHPNAQTLQAMQEVLQNKGKQYASAQDYFAYLGI